MFSKAATLVSSSASVGEVRGFMRGGFATDITVCVPLLYKRVCVEGRAHV